MNDFYSLLEKVYKTGKECAPRGYKIKELIGEMLIIDKYNFMCGNEVRPYEEIYNYWLNETCWYMSGDLAPYHIERYAKLWGEIKNEDGTVNSNYGYRVFYQKNENGEAMFDFALRRLQADKDSRNAIIPYNSPALCYSGNKDFMCTQNQHFLIRDNKLMCLIHLRSSDMIYGLYYNCPWWSLVHQQMLLNLKPLYRDLQLGPIQVFISSAHIYEKHWGLVEKILKERPKGYFIRWKNIIPLNKPFVWYFKNITDYFSTLPVKFA